jgi:hypothetical protein
MGNGYRLPLGGSGLHATLRMLRSEVVRDRARGPGRPEGLVEEHLLDERRYLAPFGIPSVSQEEPSFDPGFSLWRCWRGPAWVNIAWLLAPAMRELGYGEEADRIVGSLAHAAARYGFREYYNPLTARGLAARGFGFSTLLVDLLEQPQTEPSVPPRMMHP